MKISEFIAKLEEIKGIDGDLDVRKGVGGKMVGVSSMTVGRRYVGKEAGRKELTIQWCDGKSMKISEAVDVMKAIMDVDGDADVIVDGGEAYVYSEHYYYRNGDFCCAIAKVTPLTPATERR